MIFVIKMRVLENIIGKEVLNNNAKIIGKVKDVDIDTSLNSVQSLIVTPSEGAKKTISFNKKTTDSTVPFEMVKCIGDKIILKQSIEEALSVVTEFEKEYLI